MSGFGAVGSGRGGGGMMNEPWEPEGTLPGMASDMRYRGDMGRGPRLDRAMMPDEQFYAGSGRPPGDYGGKIQTYPDKRYPMPAPRNDYYGRPDWAPQPERPPVTGGRRRGGVRAPNYDPEAHRAKQAATRARKEQMAKDRGGRPKPRPRWAQDVKPITRPPAGLPFGGGPDDRRY